MTGRIKGQADGSVHLCGGGEFAGALLAMGLIDWVELKRAPNLLCDSVRFFGVRSVSSQLRHLETWQYRNGYLLQEYEVLRNSWSEKILGKSIYLCIDANFSQVPMALESG